jgi:hypothetical protein
MTNSLLKVATGIKLVYVGLMLVVLAVVIGVFGMCVLGGAIAAGGQGNPQAAQGGAAMVVGLGLVVGGLAVVGSIVGLVGRFYCLAVPEEAGSAKPMIMTSVVLEVVSLLISIVTTADNVGGNFIPREVKTVTSGGGALFSIAAAILFLLFARSVAEFIRRDDLGRSAMTVLWLWVATFLCYIVGLGVAFAGVALGGGAAGGAAQPQGPAVVATCAGGLLMLGALIFGLVALVMYARLLTGMSLAVRRFAEGEGYEADEPGELDEYDDRPRRDRRRAAGDESDDEDDLPPRRPW